MIGMGWVKLHRKLQISDMFQSLTAKQRDVMIQLILLANHEPHEWEWKGKVCNVERGQCVTSLKSLKKLCANDVSIKNIRTALDKLEKWQFLANESTKTGRLITVLNYDTYQAKEEPIGKDNGKQPAKDGQTGGKQAATNKKDKDLLKKIKNDKELQCTQNEIEFKKLTFQFSDIYSIKMLEDFIRYWTEKNKSGTKLKCELQQTFDIKKRLVTWSRNEQKFTKKTDIPNNDDLEREILDRMATGYPGKEI